MLDVMLGRDYHSHRHREVEDNGGLDRERNNNTRWHAPEQRDPEQQAERDDNTRQQTPRPARGFEQLWRYPKRQQQPCYGKCGRLGQLTNPCLG